MSPKITATYKVELSEDRNSLDIVDIGDKIAQEQSLGEYRWRFIDSLEKDDFSAEPVRYGENTVEIEFPTDNIAAEIPQILNYIAGDLFANKYLSRIKLVDVEFPKDFLENFKGPQFGRQEIKENMNLKKDRPLAGMIIKPSLGLRLEEIKKISKKGAEAGIDIIKEDEKLVDPSYCDWKKRLDEIISLFNKINSNSEKNILYVFNTSAREKEVLNYLSDKEEVPEWLVLMTTFISSSFKNMRRLTEEDIKTPVYAHRTGHAALTRTDHGISMEVLAKLCRLAGADFVHIGSVSGSHERNAKYMLSNKAALTRTDFPWDDLKLSMPVISGGICPDNIEINMKRTTPDRREIDKDVLFMVGSSIYAYPGNKWFYLYRGYLFINSTVQFVDPEITPSFKSSSSN